MPGSRPLEPEEKVFGIGLGRTGTTSLAAALDALGIRTAHYPDDAQTAAELMGGVYRLSILRRYQGVVDIPVAPYYAELDRLYPGSKFVLTVRDRDAWLASIERHAALLDTVRNPAFARFIWAAAYGSVAFEADRFRHAFERHRADVLAYFRDRPDDLLVMDIAAGDGWELLCPFLGCPVPPIPFPHANRGSENRTWKADADEAREVLSEVLPPMATYILVDDDKVGHELAPGRTAVPFLERDGVYWGQPPDDASAIEECERLRSAGAGFVVVAWPAFWWLDHYRRFAAYLRRHRCVVRHRRVLVFDLGRPA